MNGVEVHSNAVGTVPNHRGNLAGFKVGKNYGGAVGKLDELVVGSDAIGSEGCIPYNRQIVGMPVGFEVGHSSVPTMINESYQGTQIVCTPNASEPPWQPD
jgi:hypothetical protein